jgi:hypothetical protein
LIKIKLLKFVTKKADFILYGSEKVGLWLIDDNKSDLSRERNLIYSQGLVLLELHSLLKAVPPA